MLRDADRGGAAIAEAERGGGGLGQVDDALAVEGATVVDGDFDGIAGPLVGDFDLGAERQGAMRRRHGVLVEDFSRGGPLAVEAGTIPGGAATLGIGCTGKTQNTCSADGGDNGFLSQ